MNEISRDFVRFDEIHLENYGIFSGSNSFVFDRRRTVILGNNGSGKTTLFNALVRLGPDPAIRPNMYSDTGFPLVQVMTSGNRDLVAQYRKLIFLDGESTMILAADFDKSAYDLSFGKSTGDLERAAWEIFIRFREFIPPEFSTYRDLADSGFCAMGEMNCYGYALVFAARSILNIDLPLVLDTPFGCLDGQSREVIADYLDSLSGQQIMLISPSQSQRYEVNYRLPRSRSAS